MKLRVHAATHVGLVRDHNEDSFLADVARGYFAVADGLGGMPGGEVASQAAIAAVRAGLDAGANSSPADLATLVQRAHAAVQLAGRKFGPEGIGTTLTLAMLAGSTLHIAHVGDSFALLVRGGECRSITREHNVENERNDVLDLAPYPPSYRFALTRVVGSNEPVRPDFYEEKLAVHDRLILASDGLTDLLEFRDIANVCAAHPEPAACAEQLIASALECGGHDNVTVVIVAVEGR